MFRRSFLAIGPCLLAAGAARAELAATDVLNVAMPIDPQTLDPTTNTVNVTSIVMQNVFEALYTFDADWRIAPMLAAAMPVLSDGGRSITIPLRAGVAFHDGSTMTAADVVASLARWQKLSIRGQLAAGAIESVAAPDATTVVLTMKTAFAPLFAQMAFFNAAAAIMPAAKAQAAMGGPINNIADMVGTGPFRIVERKFDQYIRLERFAAYTPAPAPTSLFAGKRVAAVQELRFNPVPNTNTRLQSVLSGQNDVADNISTEFYDQIKRSPSADPLVVKYSGWIYSLMNSRQGLAANPKIRSAVQAAIDPESMLLAGFGSPDFFALTPSLYGKGSEFYSTNGSQLYAQKDPKRARALLQEAGYKGETFRILTSEQYDYLYKACLVAADNLREAGMKVDVQLMDWASVMERRSEPGIWDFILSFHNFVPDPMLITVFNPSFPGWWNTPDYLKALQEVNTTLDQKARRAAWDRLHGIFMRDAVYMSIGNYFALMAHGKNVHGLQPVLQTPYFNVTKTARA